MAVNINKNFADELRGTLAGPTWYDSNFNSVIEEISADTAVKKLKGFPNSIVEIVLHMTQWKIFCIRKLKGDADFDIQLHTDADWKRFNGLGDDEWQTLKDDFAKVTEELATALVDSQDDRLNDIVPGRDYSFFHMIVGIIQHETAHTTQIAYLKRLLIL